MKLRSKARSWNNNGQKETPVTLSTTFNMQSKSLPELEFKGFSPVKVKEIKFNYRKNKKRRWTLQRRPGQDSETWCDQ